MVTIVQLLDVPQHNLLHALFISFMISLDHPCEIENGSVLKYTFLLLRNNADYCCCISSHEDILLLQRAIAHPMLLCVGGHNNIFLFMRCHKSLWSICPSVSAESHNNLITDVAAHILSYFACSHCWHSS